MNRRRLFAWGLLAFFAVLAATPSSPLVAVQLQQTAAINGIVVKAGTAEPISEVQLLLTNQAGLRGQNIQQLQNTIDQARAAGVAVPPALLNQLETLRGNGGTQAAAVSLMATSGRDGRFRFPSLPVGQYTLRAEREGYFGKGLGGNYPTIVNVNLNLTAAQPSTDVSVQMLPGAAIEGKVVDADAHPVVNARVQVLRLTYQNGLPLLQNAGSTAQTDDRGNYRLFRLPPGDYYLSATPNPNRTNLLSAAARGEIPEAKEDLVRTFYPDAIDAKNARKITLHGGDEVDGMTISVRKTRTITVSGLITSGVSVPTRTGPRGNTIYPSVQLSLVPHDPDTLADQSFNTIASAALDGVTAGQFQIPNVLPGSYDLYARLQNSSPDGTGTPDPLFYLGRTSFTAGFENLSGISLAIHPPVELKGYATVEGSAAGASNNVRVALQASDSTRLAPGLNNFRQVPAGSDGSFTISSVNEGDYRFQVNTPVFFAAAAAQRGGQRGARGGGAYVQDIREGGLSVFDSGIHIGSEAPRLIEVVVKTDGGAVDGNVVDSKQQPREGAMVALVPAVQRRQNPALYRTANSDALGHFMFLGVEPGSYKVIAWENIPNGAYQNPAFVARFEEQGQSVNVTAMAISSTTVVVIPSEN